MDVTETPDFIDGINRLLKIWLSTVVCHAEASYWIDNCCNDEIAAPWDAFMKATSRLADKLGERLIFSSARQTELGLSDEFIHGEFMRD